MRVAQAIDQRDVGQTFSPIFGIFGHRQVGKTTLLSRLCSEYVALDIQSQLNRQG